MRVAGHGLRDYNFRTIPAQFHMNTGHVAVRPGGVRHCGQNVTAGTRCMIGGFCMHSQKVKYTRMWIGVGQELFERGEADKRWTPEPAVMIDPRFDGCWCLKEIE